MLLIIDIDNSIANGKRRTKLALADPGRENIELYKAYVENLMTDAANDTPISGMQSLVRALWAQGFEIVYLTGRSEMHRVTTERWLAAHRFPYAPMIMRKENDWRDAVDYKETEVSLLMLTHHTVMAIEDEPKVADKLADMGVTVLQVKYKEST